MKILLNPVPIACVLIAIAGAVMGNTAMVVLGALAAVASVGLLSARRAQNEVAQDQSQDLSPDSRILVKPHKRLAGEIATLIEQNQNSDTIRILGPDARAEADRLVAQVTASLFTRDELKKSLRGKYEAEKSLGEARTKLDHASPEEKPSLQAAISARNLEMQHYEKLESFVRKVELGVSEAEAALAEMKAKLTASLSGERASLGSDEQLRESLARMRNLNQSYDEAEQLIRGS